jgi:transketolase
MRQPVIHIYTHDSISMGEDGPTHQPVEHLAGRVVSMPSWALFAEQDQAYRYAVLPPALTARVAVEQAAPLGWERHAGDHGTIIGMTSFGASGPGDDVRSHFGFTSTAIADAVRYTIEHARSEAQ